MSLTGTFSNTVDILSQEQIRARLVYLRKSFDALPAALPEAAYSFDNFAISEEDSEERSRIGALNHHLECTFCPQGRASGPFILRGRGAGLISLVDILASFISEFPEDAILQKWVEDLISAAEHTTNTGVSSGSTKVRIITMNYI